MNTIRCVESHLSLLIRDRHTASSSLRPTFQVSDVTPDRHSPQPIFALEKSISGCSFMNLESRSFFFCSSLVGFPCRFIS